MKTNFTRLLSLMALFLIIQNVSAQDAFRTNLAAPPAFGVWTNTAIWERFNGTSWVAAGAFPTAADGVITIQAGDSVQLTGIGAGGISIDQVVVEPGGFLVIFNNTGTVTLLDGAGDDLTVDGRLYISAGTTVAGAGNILVNSGGQFTLRNSGVLSVPTTVNGTLNLGQSGVSAGTVLSTTLTNNGTGVWIDGNFTLSTNATFVNNGSLAILPAATVNLASTGTNTVTNTGSITRTVNNTVNIVPATTNTGTIGGFGTVNFTNLVSNTGTIAPGSTTAFSAGTFNVQPAAITGKTPSINIELASDGAVAGTNYDVLNVTNAVNITGATLNLTNNTSVADPVNTTYTIMTTTTGNITGPFAAVNIPTNFSITYNATNIVITKTALFALPVSWGSFNAISKGNKVSLDWTTLMEENTSHFIVEHATDPAHFSPIARLEAKGNSTYTANYQFTFNTPDLSKTNFFRIKQVDLDGKSSYSATRSVKFDKGLAVAIQVYPNPVKDLLQLNIQRENIQVMLVDQSGRTLQQRSVQPGQSTIDMQSLPTGIYQLVIFEKGVRIDAKKIVKQ